MATWQRFTRKKAGGMDRFLDQIVEISAVAAARDAVKSHIAQAPPVRIA